MRTRPRKVLGGMTLAFLLVLFAQSPSGARWRAFSDLAIEVDDEGVDVDFDRPEVCGRGIRFTVADVIAQSETPPSATTHRAPDLLAVDPGGTLLIPRTQIILPLNPVIDDSGTKRWYSKEFAFLWASPQAPGTGIELIFDTGDPETTEREVVTVQDCTGQDANWSTVGVNIRPNSTTNTIDCSVTTTVSVAILSRVFFKPSNIVVGSVRVGRRGIEAKPTSSTTGDVNGDGVADLTVQVPQNGLDCRKDTRSLFVIGKLTNGITFTGSDSVSPVNCPK